MSNELLTREQAAEYVKFSESYIKAEVRRKRLTELRFGRQVRYRISDLDAWAAKFVVKAADLGESPSDNPKNQIIEKTVGVSR